MNNYKFYRKRYVLGDIHGQWSVIINHLRRNEVDNVCYIQVGDFNIGYASSELEIERLEYMNAELAKMNSDLFIIRGNHDDPKFFKDYNNELTNIFFVPDYTVLNINFENILFIGGAISIDRVQSKMTGRPWWPDECVNFNFDTIDKLRDIDVVICHTSPDFVEPIGFNQLIYHYANNDSTLLDELRKERYNMSELVRNLMLNNKIKLFYYGHFHANYRFNHNDCDFIGLGIDNFEQMF